MDGRHARTIDAVLLDVGGVLLVPDPAALGEALTRAGVTHDPETLPWVHWRAVEQLDLAPQTWAVGSAPPTYLDGLLAAAGVAEIDRRAATEALAPCFAWPSIDLWRHVTPWAREGLAALAAQWPVALVSNADGTVVAQMHEHELCQIGDGPGIPVAAIVDSAEEGVAKPDPAVFDRAITAVGVDPSRCAYVGDTVTYDVVGAEAAGMVPLHLDPLGTCVRDDHLHAPDLVTAASLLATVGI